MTGVLVGDAPLTIKFTDVSLNTPTSWLWNFGDGTTSIIQNPVHTYTQPGTYAVTETAGNIYGNNTLAQTNYIFVFTNPVADFSANTTSGTAPLNVQFNDQSTGTVSTYLWNFGDGTTSTLQSPTHIYNTVGTYTVTETVTGPGGSNTATQTNYITVNNAVPVANFTEDNNNVVTSQNVNFSDESTGNITSYLWNFGDGATSTIQNPTHNYTTPGTYTVTETVTGPGGNNTMTNVVTVVNSIAPTVTATPNGGVSNNNQSVTLTSDQSGTIYYTTDGSNPQTSPTKVPYTTPIPINTTTTLQYSAVNSVGVWSTRYTETYIIDSSVPTITSNSTGGLFNTTQVVNLTAADADGTVTAYYTVDGTDPQNSATRIAYTEPITISNTTTLKFIAVNQAGTWSLEQTQTYTIDTTIPTANANVKSGLYNTNQTVTLTMSEPGNIYYTLNGTTPTTNSILYTKPITITSTTTLEYVAVDLANNKSVTNTQSYVIDKIAPVIIKTNPKYNAINVSLTNPITITFSENVFAGINYNDIYIKNVNTGKIVAITKTISKNTLTINLTTKLLQNNKYIIYIPTSAFKDQAGNLIATYTIPFKTG